MGKHKNKRQLIPIKKRFWTKVDIRGPNECWEWLAGKKSGGYGQIGRGRYGEGNESAPRVAWELSFGSITDALCVCHHCDNPGCVNPIHLFLGTYADNNADMVRKGRNVKPVGEANGLAKLKEVEIKEIRALYSNTKVTQEQLAKRYGVHPSNISYIVNRRSWRHLI